MSEKREIVVYANQLNQVALGTLKEQEQNLFFSILVKLKDKGHAPVHFSQAEIAQMVKMHFTSKQIAQFVSDLKSHFFKLDFTKVLKNSDGSVEEENINLFKRMVIKFSDENKTHIENLTIEVNEQFEFMLNELTSNFTQFELCNFLILKTKYSKTLFRLLTQFKNLKPNEKGEIEVYFELPRLKELLGIPDYLKIISRIEQVVLKPAVSALNWNEGQIDMLTDYRGAESPAFPHLRFEKVKKNSNKKTSKVMGYWFIWKPLKEDQKLIKQRQTKDENGNLIPKAQSNNLNLKNRSTAKQSQNDSALLDYSKKLQKQIDEIISTYKTKDNLLDKAEEIKNKYGFDVFIKTLGQVDRR